MSIYFILNNNLFILNLTITLLGDKFLLILCLTFPLYLHILVFVRGSLCIAYNNFLLLSIFSRCVNHKIFVWRATTLWSMCSSSYVQLCILTCMFGTSLSSCYYIMQSETADAILGNINPICNLVSQPSRRPTKKRYGITVCRYYHRKSNIRILFYN